MEQGRGLQLSRSQENLGQVAATRVKLVWPPE